MSPDVAVTLALAFMLAVLLGIFAWAFVVGVLYRRDMRRRQYGPVTPPPYIERQKRQ